MKKGQLLEGLVESVDFPNKGIVKAVEEKEDGTTEERYFVVKNTIPGAKIKFRISKMRKHKSKGEGNFVETIEHSPLERECPCPHFGICGGCTYLCLPYETQLEMKEKQVKKLLDQVLLPGQGDYVFEGIIPSPKKEQYRNKMEFSFGDAYKDGPLSLGMHKRGSFYDVVTVDGCRLVDEDFGLILQSTLTYFQDKEIPYYHRMRKEGYLRHLLVRKAEKTGEILLDLVTTTSMTPDLETWKETLLALPLKGTIVGILHTVNDAVADVVKNDGTDILYGRDYFYEELLGLRFKISPFSFFQTNSGGAEVLYQKAREYIGDIGTDKTVYDLYSGTGTIAQLMAPVAKQVIGVEIVEEAVDAAKKNAALNGLENCDFLAGDVLQVLDTITEKPDFIILDPPRDGVHPKALQKILDYGVDRLLYISCKPTSLTRDLEAFLEHGYQVERSCLVDQFPFTANVETIALLSKNR